MDRYVLLCGCMVGCIARLVVVEKIYGWKCWKRGGDCVDVWMDMSVSAWWLCGCMDGCVGRCMVVVWMYGWICRYLGGFWMDGCAGRWVVVGGCMDGSVGRWVVFG